MKLKEWYNFVFCSESVLANWGDIYVKVFRKKSFKNEDECFSALLEAKDAIKLFGEYNLFCTTNHMENDYKTICVLLYPDEKEGK